jgi:Flp pilus assembly protein TadG
MRGQSMVEFALVFPILLLLIIAVIEGGYFAWSYLAVDGATHEGARRAAIPTTTYAQVTGKVVAAVRPLVVAAGDVSVRINGTVVSSSSSAWTNRGLGDRVQVRTTYVHRPLVDAVFGAGIAFTFTGRAELMVERR